jgi:hypothetical protein
MQPSAWLDTSLRGGQGIWDAAAVDGVQYLATDAGVLFSEDGGYT